MLAARALGPEAFAAVGALWAGMFLIAVLLFRPLEQTVSRTVADLVARGADARAAVRTTAWLGGGVAVVACLACVAAWGPLTDGLFGGRAELTVALVAGLAGYALSYFARGLAGGVRWFGGYGLVLLADGGIRLIVALPLLVVGLDDAGGDRDRRGRRSAARSRRCSRATAARCCRVDGTGRERARSRSAPPPASPRPRP